MELHNLIKTFKVFLSPSPKDRHYGRTKPSNTPCQVILLRQRIIVIRKCRNDKCLISDTQFIFATSFSGTTVAEFRPDVLRVAWVSHSKHPTTASQPRSYKIIRYCSNFFEPLSPRYLWYFGNPWTTPGPNFVRCLGSVWPGATLSFLEKKRIVEFDKINCETLLKVASGNFIKSCIEKLPLKPLQERLVHSINF